MFSYVRPYTFVALRLPSSTHKVLKIVPHTTISIGKYGSFPANLLLDRPYYLTYEVLDREPDETFSWLRIVAAAEIQAEILPDAASPDAVTPRDGIDVAEESQAFNIIGDDGVVLTRSNRLTVDDPSRQTLSMEEIEDLKKAGGGSGRDIIAKLMHSHSALDEKTEYSLAKYTLRKSRKYMKRFTVLPLDVSQLAHWMITEKEPARIMEVREEVLGIIASWSNVHYSLTDYNGGAANGRWLVVDDTGGLIVAELAERMGILYPEEYEQSQDEDELMKEDDSDEEPCVVNGEVAVNGNVGSAQLEDESSSRRPQEKRRNRPPEAMSALSNTITLLHPAVQPNISLLSYFLYDPNDSGPNDPYPATSHPLHTHLKSLSWLQLLYPEDDSAYAEPEHAPEDVVAAWKSSKRGTYYRKRRRWERTKQVVDETRAGGFDGLVVASAMVPTSILLHAVPLLRGGAQIVVYSPSLEPLADLADAYSSARKTAFIKSVGEGTTPEVPSEDFAVDPRLVLAPTLQTARAKQWQVLPGRTHPLMTSRGGAEGYLFTGTRVIPTERRVEARGRFVKKRKPDASDVSMSIETHMSE